MSINPNIRAVAAAKRVDVYTPKQIKSPLVLVQDPTTEFIFWAHISMPDAAHLTADDVDKLFNAGDSITISPIMTIANFFNNWGDPRNDDPPKRVKSPTGDPYYWGKYREQIRALYGSPGEEDDGAPLTSTVLDDDDVGKGEGAGYSRKRRVLWLIDHAGGSGGGSTVNECCYWS